MFQRFAFTQRNLETLNLRNLETLVLRLVIAGFPAGATVVATVLAQANVILSEADGTVTVTGALLLVLLTNDALKPGGFHGLNLASGLSPAKLPKCAKTNSSPQRTQRTRRKNR
jgi:hypothetical protein